MPIVDGHQWHPRTSVEIIMTGIPGKMGVTKYKTQTSLILTDGHTLFDNDMHRFFFNTTLWMMFLQQIHPETSQMPVFQTVHEYCAWKQQQQQQQNTSTSQKYWIRTGRFITSSSDDDDDDDKSLPKHYQDILSSFSSPLSRSTLRFLVEDDDDDEEDFDLIEFKLPLSDIPISTFSNFAT